MLECSAFTSTRMNFCLRWLVNANDEAKVPGGLDLSDLIGCQLGGTRRLPSSGISAVQRPASISVTRRESHRRLKARVFFFTVTRLLDLALGFPSASIAMSWLCPPNPSGPETMAVFMGLGSETRNIKTSKPNSGTTPGRRRPLSISCTGRSRFRTRRVRLPYIQRAHCGRVGPASVRPRVLYEQRPLRAGV